MLGYKYCTASNYYTGLIETSKTHFYGRAAAELSFSEGILRTFTGLREAVSFSHCNTRLLQYVQICRTPRGRT